MAMRQREYIKLTLLNSRPLRLSPILSVLVVRVRLNRPNGLLQLNLALLGNRSVLNPGASDRLSS